MQLKQKYKKTEILEFYQCSRCHYLPYLNVDDLMEQLYMRLKYKFDKKPDNKTKRKTKDGLFEIISYSPEVFPLLNAYELRHSLPKLSSVYSTIYGKEPQATNHREEFSGCLDYIFVCKNCKVITTDKISDVEQLQFIPNKTHGSDHLPLKTIIY